MRKSIFYVLILILLVSFFVLGDSDNDMGLLCEELLIKRAEAWDKIMEEDYDYDAFYKDMSAIASGKLLEEDLESFAYLKEYPTDMEKVDSLQLKVNNIGKYGGNITVKGKILWNLEAQEGPEAMEGDYKIDMAKQNGSWYLIDFQPMG